MITKTRISTSFKEAVNHVYYNQLEPDESSLVVLDSSGLRTCHAEEMTRDFEMGRRARPGLGQAVWYTLLSFHPDDTARLDNATLLEIALAFMEQMGLLNTQYVIVRPYTQLAHQFVHIVANRVDNEGEVISDRLNFVRSNKTRKKLIETYGLTPPQGHRLDKQHPERMHGAELVKYQIRKALNEALEHATDEASLSEALVKNGITVWVRQPDENGQGGGISFKQEGGAASGKQLGREYIYTSIIQRLHANQSVISPLCPLGNRND